MRVGDTGARLFIEIAETRPAASGGADDDGMTLVAISDGVARAKELSQQVLDSGFQLARNVAETFAANANKIEPAPSTVELSFGMEASAEGNWILGKASGKANFTMKVTWKAPDKT
jgi:hypothetical protein